MGTPSEFVGASARTLARMVRDREVSARELTLAHLEHAHACAPLGAFRRLAPERALAEAAAVDAGRRDGPLCGVPVALKDNFVTLGLETGCGSRILEGWIPPYQGAQAQRLADAGAVCLGKLAMDEFAMGSSNENTPYEAVHNPWAPDYVPGGSSGGSAVAVATGACALALGSDTGGSIRQPASFTNLVGLKPTYGRVSRHGLIAFASSFDQAGPLAREVRDAALALAVLAGADPRDATCLDAPVADYLAACELGASGRRVGVHRAALALAGLDDEVRAAFERSLELLRDAGAEIVDIELPHFAHAVATYYVLATAEASSNLARYDGLRYGRREPCEELLATYRRTRELGFGAEVKRRILLGTFVLRADSYADYYGRAMKVRTRIARDYEEAFAHCDVIASPVSPVAGFRRGERSSDPLAMYLSDVFTVGANLAGLPAIAIPGGFTRGDAGRPALPIGLQLTARRLAEPVLFAVAAAHEDRSTWHLRRPPAGAIAGPASTRTEVR